MCNVNSYWKKGEARIYRARSNAVVVTAATALAFVIVVVVASTVVVVVVGVSSADSL